LKNVQTDSTQFDAQLKFYPLSVHPAAKSAFKVLTSSSNAVAKTEPEIIAAPTNVNKCLIISLSVFYYLIIVKI